MEKEAIDSGTMTDLHLRVLVQPWLAGNVKVTAGIAPITDIEQMPNYLDPRCPLIEVFSMVLPLMPRADSGMAVPFYPYLMDSRTKVDSKPLPPKFSVIQRTVFGLLKSATAPNIKKSSWEKASKEDWDSGRSSRYTLADPEIDDVDEDDAGEKSDNEGQFGGQHLCQVLSKQSPLCKCPNIGNYIGETERAL